MDHTGRHDSEPDRERADSLTHHLHIAADKLDVTPLDDPTFTGEMRTVGIHAHHKTADV